MNACIYAILNKRKCEICSKDKRLFTIPVVCDIEPNEFNVLNLCNKCLIKLSDQNIISISFNNNKEKKENS